MLSRGSEWRRWDLHVHTPGTNLNDQYGDWESFLKLVEDHPDVRAMGVTDYFTVDNYEKAVSFHESGRMDNIALLLPNLEFRVSPQNDKARAVNLHLLVSPDDPKHIEKLRDALSRLVFEYDGQRYPCSSIGLRNLGVAVEGEDKGDAFSLRKGCEQFKPSFTDFREWFRGEQWLSQNSLVGASGNDDGLSGFEMDGGFSAVRKEMTRFADAIFSARPKERDFWLGNLSEENRQAMVDLKGPKPCWHGSDAHDEAKLFAPDGDRFTWIKADLTFDGLRQTIFEPGERVWIGPSSPAPRDISRTLSSVKISDPRGWFPDTSIPLNSGLVAIVGEKGAGKSALAELIAYGAGADLQRDSSFFSRAAEAIKDTEVSIEWGDGRTSSRMIGDINEVEEGVRYLSQTFVERLCNEDHGSSELVREIEKLVFSYLSPTDRLNASSFVELREIKTESVKEVRSELSSSIDITLESIEKLQKSRARLPELEARNAALEKEKGGLHGQAEDPGSTAVGNLEKDYASALAQLAAIQAQIASANSKLEKAELVQTKFQGFKARAEQFFAELAPELSELGFAPSEIEAFRPTFNGEAHAAVKRVEGAIRSQITGLTGSADDPEDGTETALIKRLEALAKIELADKKKQEQLIATQKRLSEISAALERVNAEIEAIRGPEAKRLAELRKSRATAYLRWFELLNRERGILDSLYSPIAERLSKGTVQERMLKFFVRTQVDLRGWIERGVALFDQRKVLPYSSIDNMERAARETLLPAWLEGDPHSIGQAMADFSKEFDLDGNPNYLRNGLTANDVWQWLLSHEHLTLSYGLRYQGVELSKLSPGTKGIVLLILYLGMDREDTRPLIVDQPDENLDSESIYGLLTEYFREAKQQRQIIIVTHDPNLVVNTDAEQVVVATSERAEDGNISFHYSAGPLEDCREADEKIRASVCRILEGGRDAFNAREKRYKETLVAAS